jgi:hypothetical protein
VLNGHAMVFITRKNLPSDKHSSLFCLADRNEGKKVLLELKPGLEMNGLSFDSLGVLQHLGELRRLLDHQLLGHDVLDPLLR